MGSSIGKSKKRLAKIYIALATAISSFGFLWWIFVIGADILSVLPEKAGLSDFIFDVFILRVMPVLLLIIIILCVVCGIMNIVASFRNYKNDPEACIENLRLLKYGMIPCFVINFIWMVILGFLIAVGSLLLGLVWFLPFAVIASWLYLLPGAFYGIQVIRVMKRRQGRGAVFVLINGIFQFCFVLDVIDTAYLSGEWV